MNQPSLAIRATVTGVIDRTMRAGGVNGDIKVDRIRATKTGYTARAVRTERLVRAEYRAYITGRHVKVVRVTEPERLV